MVATERKNRAGGEAADWFARLQAGDMERAEREHFVEWLRESHVHVAEMMRVAQIHGALESFQRWADISTGPKTDADDVAPLPLQQEIHLKEQPLPGHARRMGTGLGLFAMAATVLLIAASIVVLPRIRGQVIETDRGERREVVLADGSLLQVDPETRLRVKYSDSARRVFLERGRAFFHVAKSPQRPFLVKADDTTVRAVGTAFGVEQRLQGVIVTVAEGKVAVSAHELAARTLGNQSESGNETLPGNSDRGRAIEQPGPPPTESRPASEVFLRANQQVTVQTSGAAEPVREIDSQRELAWARGRLIFENDRLEQAIEEFNRYNRVQLAVADPELAAKPVSGVFNASEPEAFIAFLQSVTDISIVRDGDRSITIGSVRH